MWHYRRACIDNIRLRVLHANIQASENIKQLTFSACSLKIAVSVPFCSVYFLVDLFHELQTKFPHVVINLSKRTEDKSYGFFETSSLQKGRGGHHQPCPTLRPIHIHASFLTSSPCSYLITDVLQFEYLGLILDPKLTMHLTTTKAIQRAIHSQSVTLPVSCSLRYDKKRSQLTPTLRMGLWKSTVL